MSNLPDEAYATALASLPFIAAARLSELSLKFGWSEAWRLAKSDLLRGKLDLRTSSERSPDEILASWVGHLEILDVEKYFHYHLAAGIQITLAGSPHMPACFAAESQPPQVIFSKGSLASLVCPCVGVVGTRRASSYGLSMAHQIGSSLAEVGVSVVSGLALGIDGAAHRGVLSCRESAQISDHERPPSDEPARHGVGATVGIVASGLDVIYPSQHRDLWTAVIDNGVLISEVPLGGRPLPWRFSQRNRLIAAASHAVICVESKHVGGSMATARMALNRGTNVLCVPGALTNPLSQGPHDLLYEGASVYRNVDDAVVALSSTAPWTPQLSTTLKYDAARSAVAHSTDPVAAAVLTLLLAEPLSLDSIVALSALPLPDVVRSLRVLQANGAADNLLGQWVATTSNGKR